MSGSKNAIIFWVTAARIAAALLILSAPVAGLLLTLFLDYLDGRIFAATHAMEREAYTRWDKVLDLLGYIAELIVVGRMGLLIPFLILFAWRMTGYAMFVLTEKEWLLLLFPNIFEAAVIWVLFGLAGWNWLWLLIGLKLVQEWSLHWFVPHGGNKWWDSLMRKMLPEKSWLLRFSLSLSQKTRKRR